MTTTEAPARLPRQHVWAQMPVRDRLRILKRGRDEIARCSSQLANDISRPIHETYTAEILPLLEACRFLERNAEQILAPKIFGDEGQPLWLRGVELEIRREPLGVILIIGPANYPLFLAAVQALQALAAGNAVILKPGRSATAALSRFVNCLVRAGVPAAALHMTGESPQDVTAAIEAGVDKVVFTGSNSAGLAVMAQLARTGTPSVMELSGDDSVFVRPGADIGLVVRAVRFGTTLNGGNTCIAPKRLIVWTGLAELLRSRLDAEQISLPVVEVSSDEEALAISESSGYGLGATVFGRREDAYVFAHRIRAGSVVINDMIVPTADPRLPFGGRGNSGFGVTRGAEGLLEMTAVKTIAIRRSRWLPHLDPVHRSDEELFQQYIMWSHASSVWRRMRALAGMSRALLRRR